MTFVSLSIPTNANTERWTRIVFDLFAHALMQIATNIHDIAFGLIFSHPLLLLLLPTLSLSLTLEYALLGARYHKYWGNRFAIVKIVKLHSIRENFWFIKRKVLWPMQLTDEEWNWKQLLILFYLKTLKY